jgi:hypothetical protein
MKKNLVNRKITNSFISNVKIDKGEFSGTVETVTETFDSSGKKIFGSQKILQDSFWVNYTSANWDEDTGVITLTNERSGKGFSVPENVFRNTCPLCLAKIESHIEKDRQICEGDEEIECDFEVFRCVNCDFTHEHDV